MERYPVIATGRPPILVKEIAEELAIDTYITMNGQYIVHNNEVIYANPIDMDLVDGLVKLAVDRRDGIVLSTADGIIANSMISLVNRGSLFTFLKSMLGLMPERIKVKLWHRLMKKAPEKEMYENEEIFMMNINANQEEQIVYEQIFGDYLTFTRANEMALDIISKGISKATGIERLMAELDVTHEDTYAFGDGLNDLEMLQYVNMDVAMGNSFEELKLVANLVTDSVFNDGIAKGLQKLRLI